MALARIIRDPRWRAAVVLVALVGLAAWAWAQGWHARLDPAALEAWVLERGALGVVGLMLVLAGAVVVAPIPTIPVTVTFGMVYGLWLGTLYSVIGGLAGALAAFAIARFGGREAIRRLAGHHVVLNENCSDRMLFAVVFVARLIPVVSFGLVSYGAGLTAMTARAFALATALGMAPMTIVYAMLGSQIAVGTAWAILGSVVLVAALLALPQLARRYNWFGLGERFPLKTTDPQERR